MLLFFCIIYLPSVAVMTTLLAVHLRTERYIDRKVIACAVFMALMPILNTFLVIDWGLEFYTDKSKKRNRA